LKMTSSDSDYNTQDDEETVSDDRNSNSESESDSYDQVKPTKRKTKTPQKDSDSSTETESEEEEESFRCIDVNTNDTVVGAKGTELTFLSPTGKKVDGYTTKYHNKQPFSPTKLLLHNKGEKILTLTPVKSVVCQFDTETGKNIQEVNVKLFHPQVDAKLDTVVPLQKFGQFKIENEISLATITGNSVSKIQWDTREPVVKDYVLDPERSLTKAVKGFRFTAITTTKEGHIAVGAKDGSIRLYTAGQKLKKSKTELSQLADPIIGLDVSANGDWLLGTSHQYLIVFKTVWSDSKGEHSAFNESMPSSEKRLLVLRIPKEHLEKFKIKKIDFTPARFDNGPYLGNDDIIEEEIVTSTGNSIIRFRFRQVKIDYNKGRRQKRAKPIIYKQDEEIVDKSFSYSGDSIVAALCSDLKKIELEDK